MTRRGRRGTDGAQDEEGFWLPDDPGPEGGDEGSYPETGRRGRAPGPSGPPWVSGGWQAEPGWATGAGPADTGWQGHPSGPLPAGLPEDPHPSGPLPPLPETGNWDQGPYPAGGTGGYPAGGYGSGGYPDDSYPDGSYPDGSGAFPGGDYRTGGFPAAGDYPGGTGGYPAGDYQTGGYQAADYAGSGFGEPLHREDYAGPGYGDDSGFPGMGDDYQDDPRSAGYAGRDPGNHPGYPDRGGWYGEVDEQQVWAGEDEDDSGGFLPGLDDDRDRGGRRPEPSRPGRGRPAGRPAKRKRSGLRKIMPRVFLGLLLLILLAGGGMAYHIYRTYIHPPDYAGPGTGSVVVHIPAGDTATAIGTLLQDKGVVASARAFGNAAKASPQGNALEPGYYRLHKHMQASLALAMLLKPSSRVTFRVLIPEGYRLSRIIATLGKATGNLAGYQAAIKKTAQLGLPAYAKGNPEGYLFPATYTVQPGTPPLQVLQQMVQRFGQTATAVNLASVARAHQISEHDVIVVASLIQAEGGRLQDYPKIARVIYNRLYVAHMQLELDSTIMYALHTYGILASNQQLNVNSPYNTYRHFGLPPGPIDSPGQAAIDAALHPAQGTWLYFVTVDPKTGLTKFTSDPNVFAQLKAELQKNLGQG